MRKEIAENLVFAVYMMIGSAFRKVHAFDPYQAKRLERRYQRAKEAEQLEVEEVALAYLSGVLRKELPQDLFEQEAGALLKTGEDEYGVAFACTDGRMLCVYSSLEKNRYWLRYELYEGGEVALTGKACRVKTRREAERMRERACARAQARERRTCVA